MYLMIRNALLEVLLVSLKIALFRKHQIHVLVMRDTLM